jgi:hypothetical protein
MIMIYGPQPLSDLPAQAQMLALFTYTHQVLLTVEARVVTALDNVAELDSAVCKRQQVHARQFPEPFDHQSAGRIV